MLVQERPATVPVTEIRPKKPKKRKLPRRGSPREDAKEAAANAHILVQRSMDLATITLEDARAALASA